MARPFVKRSIRNPPAAPPRRYSASALFGMSPYAMPAFTPPPSCWANAEIGSRTTRTAVVMTAKMLSTSPVRMNPTMEMDVLVWPWEPLIRAEARGGANVRSRCGSSHSN